MMRFRWVLVVCLLAWPAQLHAQAWTPMAGHGAVSVGAQYSRVFKHLFSTNLNGYVDPPTGYVGGPKNAIYLGDIVGATTMVSADYGLVQRLAVSAEAAYVSSRYRGLDPESSIDNGKFHGSLQDLLLGARYRLPVSAVALTPFATFRAPLGHYTTMGHSAPGLGLKELDLGLAAGRTLGPLLPRVALEAIYTRDIVEDKYGFSLDRNIVEADAAWFPTGSFTLGARFSYTQSVDGIDWATGIVTEEDFMNHDVAARALARHGGASAEYRLNPRSSLSVAYEWTISGSNTHAVQGVTLAITRGFSTRHG
jgi:hypothetical protein